MGKEQIEYMQEEMKNLRSDVDRLFQVVEKLTEKVDRLSVIAGGLADYVVPKGDVK